MSEIKNQLGRQSTHSCDALYLIDEPAEPQKLPSFRLRHRNLPELQLPGYIYLQ